MRERGREGDRERPVSLLLACTVVEIDEGREEEREREGEGM